MFIPGNIDSTNATSGALQVTGGVGIAKKLYVGTDTSIGGITKITDGTDSSNTTSGALQVTGGVGIAKKLYVGTDTSIGGITKITKDTDSDGTNATSGALQVTGGVGIAKKLYVGTDTSIGGITKITDGTDSSNATSGALQVTGGVGIAKKLYVGTDSYFNGDVRCSKKLYIGINDPGGGGGDVAYLEYVQISGENTTLRLVVTNDSEDHINLNPTGRVGIGTDTPAYKLDVQGTIRATGEITGGSFNTPSDYRIKQNVQKLNKTIDELKPVEYDISGGRHDMGFIAHEVQEIFPFLVNGEKDGKELQSINYTGFISLLVKEVQDLKKENKQLHDKNEQFENRLKVLENMFHI